MSTPTPTSASSATTDPFTQDHPFAGHLRQVLEVDAVAPHQPWTPQDEPLPVFYLSHGAPPTFEDSEWMLQLRSWARSVPKPRGVVIVSAHWETDGIGMSSAAPRSLVYDFTGFDPVYYRVRYDTPPAHELGRALTRVMPSGQRVHEHADRGLDHGAWVPLKVMYPHADVPVVQMSLPTRMTGESLMRLGAHLSDLREQGVLVIGSGFMTHGLRYLTPQMMVANHVPGWSREFDEWAANALERRDVDELLAFREKAPAANYAHPTVEHFTPLFIALGAGTEQARLSTPVQGFAMGLSKRSVQLS